ncbi:MBL fold metallo-hydrolase [bacterium]|nr:MBL fold metallo-hydrolase [bacterium]
MKSRVKSISMVAALFSCMILISGCDKDSGLTENSREKVGTIHNEPGIPPTVQPSLWKQSDEFNRKIYTVTDGVYQSVGWGISNSIMVEGDKCVFVVDACDSLEHGQEVLKEFRKITDKPVKALIYTHNHVDHFLGSEAFGKTGQIDVYAHDTTNYYINRVINIIRPIIAIRSNRMFGTYLPKGAEGFVNGGLGPEMEVVNGKGTPTLIRPTKTFKDELTTTICGVKVRMIHAPGETNDQIMVWLPEKKTIMPGDNFYKAFPNLYTIRGTLYRDVIGWAHSVDLIRRLEPEFIAPSHTKPLAGKEKIASILTDYRDGIQYVHDQTIRLMNKGYTVDEIVEEVKLPDHLRNHPFLLEHYGTVEWSVRSVFSGYLGWFDGDTATLSKPSPTARAKGMIEIAGGRDALLNHAKSAFQTANYKWTAELTSYLIKANADDTEAKQLKANALRQLGYQSVSPNGRNTYLTQALELEGNIIVESPPITKAGIRLAEKMPIGNYMEAMTVALVPEKSLDVDQIVTFHFTNVNESHSLHVRKGIAEYISKALPGADIELAMDTGTWIQIVSGYKSFPGAIAKGELSVKGGLTGVPKLVGFLSMFQE